MRITVSFLTLWISQDDRSRRYLNINLARFHQSNIPSEAARSPRTKRDVPDPLIRTQRVRVILDPTFWAGNLRIMTKKGLSVASWDGVRRQPQHHQDYEHRLWFRLWGREPLSQVQSRACHIRSPSLIHACRYVNALASVYLTTGNEIFPPWTASLISARSFA